MDKFNTTSQLGAPKGGPNYKVSNNTSFESGDSPEIINCNDALNGNAENATIQCDGEGSILVALSKDGVLYSDDYTLKKNEAIIFCEAFIHSIRITYDTADSSYRIIYQ